MQLKIQQVLVTAQNPKSFKILNNLPWIYKSHEWFKTNRLYIIIFTHIKSLLIAFYSMLILPLLFLRINIFIKVIYYIYFLFQKYL